MSPERWRKLKELLGPALEMDASQRSAYLEQVCAQDPSLRPDLDRLIAADDRPGPEIFRVGVFSASELLPSDFWIGRRVGAYKLVERIGSGGMGHVYRAHRADDQYRKQVAVKLLHSGANSDSIVSRFKNERQILASLDHPNIARLLDGGTIEEGLPYFVMELIEGQPINEYCKQQELPVPRILQLFLQVCSAVQYAHSHLIIHRDIKPHNILVTADGLPKLLDFGIAKILDPSNPGLPAPTVTMFQVLTPSYASPEQIKGEAITTATDVYSLGVVLYELLAGRSPYRLATATPQEVSRAVTDSEPVKPSDRCTEVPGSSERQQIEIKSRRDASEKFRNILRGDLDNIVLMALRKEPGRRYASVEQFAEDIRRHLHKLPVIARRDTLRYRTSKFISRHRAGVAATAIATLALILGFIVIIREARIARANQLRAEKRFNDVRKLANSLMFEINDSVAQLPGATSARKLIIQRAQEYLDSLAQESSNDPALLRDLAVAYGKLADVQGDSDAANMGDTAGALRNDHRAVALLENACSLEPRNGELRRELALRYIGLSRTLGLRVGDKAGYSDGIAKALGILEPLVSANPQDAAAQDALAAAYDGKAQYFRYENDMTASLDHERKALAIFERLAKAQPDNELYLAQISRTHRNLGAVLTVQKQWSAALAQYRSAVPLDEAQVARHPESVTARMDLSLAYSNTGFILVRERKMNAGLRYYLKALNIRQTLAAADPEDTRAITGLGNTYGYIGSVYAMQRRYPQAIEYEKKALNVRQALSRKDPADKVAREGVAWVQGWLGHQYANMAFRARSSPRNQLTYCQESITWLEPAVPILLQRQAEGRLWGSDNKDLNSYRRDLDSCRQSVSRLKAAAASYKRR